MKRSKRFLFRALLIAVLFAIPVFMPSMQVEAKSEVVAIEGVSYNVNASLADNLKSLIGKKVLVTCVSGNAFSGFVKGVGDHFIHLEKLDSKEYFDALIRIENICAVEAQFRKVQR